MKSVVDMAREAGWTSYDSQDERFEKFAELVRAEEHEAYAKFFQDHWKDRWTDEQIIETIRARK